MAKFHVLLADEKDRIQRLQQLFLDTGTSNVDTAEDGESALSKALALEYDIVLLGWTIPFLPAIEVCQLLKCMKTTPVILLNDDGNESDRLRGFEAGADDYILRPFNPQELLYRVQAILKRTKRESTPDYSIQKGTIILSPLYIDHPARRITVHNEELSLTPKEYELLRFFAINFGKTLTRDYILREVWGKEFEYDSLNH
ncbi:response regulator transcription factor [Paenibacillus sp. TAB 01]|uniref:response regulator transcription factor n=1 Tax=Paenibacillus sp. TAB 01 TaxID=3368988 RepID=UPI0037500239